MSKPKRNRTSAKQAGARFERQIADTLAEHIDDRIDRKVKTGSKDTGDIGGMRAFGRRVTIECKNTSRINLGVWAAEAEIERGNDDGLAAVVVHKRHGVGDPLCQWVTMPLADFIALHTGERPDNE